MRILAIETSCDETGVALVDGSLVEEVFSFDVMGGALLSQAALHAPYGGVYPSLAKREHEKNLPFILEEALRAAQEKIDAPLKSIDAIAVTSGPGLEPALWTGITFAKELAQKTGKPLMSVNHMEGHLVSSLVQQGTLKGVVFPVLGLLISGGHTEFVLAQSWCNYTIVGKTLDDAVGEAFDKVARLLDLPYPGGPHISRLADSARRRRVPPPGLDDNNFSFQLPRPMLRSNNCDMSFSGLKTAALYALRGKILKDEEKALFAQEFEDSVGDVFVAKTRKALIETNAKTFVIGGGVAANRYLRERLQACMLEEFPEVEFRLPELSITGDNAVMIAEAALLHCLLQGIPTGDGAIIRAEGQLSL